MSEARPDPFYNVFTTLDECCPGVVMTMSIENGLLLAYQANAYRPLSCAQVQAVVGPLIAEGNPPQYQAAPAPPRIPKIMPGATPVLAAPPRAPTPPVPPAPGVKGVTAGDGLLVNGMAGATITETGIISLDTPLSVARGGTGTGFAGGHALDNISGFAATGYVQRTGAAAYALGPLPIIAASDVGMNPAAADNSAALAAALTSRNGIIDGGYQTFRFTQAGGAGPGSGPLSLSGLKGLRGLRNITLDFSACLSDSFCLYIAGVAPTTPVALSLDAAAGAQSVVVADPASFHVGQPVIVNSDAAWCPYATANGIVVTTNEFNRVIAVDLPSRTISLQTPLKNNYRAADNAILMALWPDATAPAGWSPLRFVADGVTLIGAGPGRTAAFQQGIRLLYTQGSYINADIRACYDYAVNLSQMCLDTFVPCLKVVDAAGVGPGLGYGLVVGGSARVQIGKIIAENTGEALTQSSSSATYGGHLIGIIGRDVHCNAVLAAGGRFVGGAVNSHPGSANLWVDYAYGATVPPAQDFICLMGYQQGVGHAVCPSASAAGVVLQYAGGRDALSNSAFYRIGSLDIGGTGAGASSGNALAIQCLSQDPARPNDFIGVGGLTANNCARGISIDSSSGPIGIVDIGASVVNVTGTIEGYGLFLLTEPGGYPMGRVNLRDAALTTAGQTSGSRAVLASTSGVSAPELHLTNVTLAGGDWGIYLDDALAFLHGKTQIGGVGVDEYLISAGSFLTIYGEAPTPRRLAAGSITTTMLSNRQEIGVSTTGLTQTIALPPARWQGQEAVVSILTSPTAVVWTSPDAKPVNGAPATIPAWGSSRLRYDGAAWNAISADGGAALAAGRLLKGGAPGGPTASAWWFEDGANNLAVNYAGVGSTSTKGLVITANDGANPSLTGIGFAAPGMQLTGTRYGGTNAARAPTEANAPMLVLNALGYDGAAAQTRATIQYYSAEAWGVGNNGAKIRFSTTPVGSVAVAQGAVLEADGTWYVGSNASSTAVNTGAGTVHAQTGYYLNQKNVTPGTLQIAQTSPANPTGTANTTTGVMMGLAGAITPQATSRVKISISGDIFNATAAGDGASAQIRWGTGTAPANGAAPVGTAAGAKVQYIAATTAQKTPFSLAAIVTGLAAGTAYWIDLALTALTAGTANVENLSITAFEL